MVIGQFYPVVGGAERACVKLSKELIRRGHEITVLTTWIDRGAPRFEEVEGIPVQRIWYPVFFVRGRRVGLGVLAPLFLFVQARRAAARHDVIHVHQALWPLFSGALAAAWHRKPLICKIGNSGQRFDLDVLRRSHAYGRLATWIAKRVTAKFIFTSKAVEDDLVAEGLAANRLASIPNGVELRDDSSSVRSGDTGVLRFIFTGTFTLKKNLRRLIEAVSGLGIEERSRMRLLLLGDGPDRELLSQMIQSAKLENTIEIRGPVDDVFPDLEKSHVFILPSETEGLSNSALEAMACGLPVILSDRGGNADLVPGPYSEAEMGIKIGRTGVLIDPGRTASITTAMKYMISEDRQRLQMGEAARGRISERYTLGHVADQYETLYHTLIHSHEERRSASHLS